MSTVERFRKGLWLLLGTLMVAGIGTLEYYSDPEITYSILYIAPVALGVWYVGEGAGLFFSALVAVDWLIHEQVWGHFYSSEWIPMWNAIVRSAFLFVITILLSRLKTAMERDHELARHDSLTGLANRRGFYERLDIEMKRSRRMHEPLTIAYMDLDNFKYVNDQWGHAAGDRALKTITQVMNSQLRGMDVAARLGGDEFALLLPETSADGAKKAVIHLRENLNQAMHQHQWPITFSVGLVTYTKLPETIPEIMSKADDLMYNVKRSGKNRITQEVLPG